MTRQQTDAERVTDDKAVGVKDGNELTGNAVENNSGERRDNDASGGGGNRAGGARTESSWDQTVALCSRSLASLACRHATPPQAAPRESGGATECCLAAKHPY